jgi:hypothetical protein
MEPRVGKHSIVEDKAKLVELAKKTPKAMQKIFISDLLERMKSRISFMFTERNYELNLFFRRQDDPSLASRNEFGARLTINRVKLKFTAAAVPQCSNSFSADPPSSQDQKKGGSCDPPEQSALRTLTLRS